MPLHVQAKARIVSDSSPGRCRLLLVKPPEVGAEADVHVPLHLLRQPRQRQNLHCITWLWLSGIRRVLFWMPGEARATELGTDSATLRRMVSGTRRRGGGRTQVMAISRWLNAPSGQKERWQNYTRCPSRNEWIRKHVKVDENELQPHRYWQRKVAYIIY